MPNSTILQRVVAVSLSAAVVLSLSGAALLVPLYAGAQTVVDGDLIRGSGSFDVYIVKDMGAKKFRRLILNPDIFNSYGHLEWGNVKVVDQAVVDGYVDSQLVRNVDGTKVYTLVPNGEDTGDKNWLNMTAAEFVADGYDWDSIYGINVFEEDLYVSGADIGPGGGPPIVSGPVSVSLSPDTAGSSTVPGQANNLSYGTWRLTGTGTVSSLTFTRMGVGAPAAFDEVYLYSNGVRLTSARVVNTSTNSVTFGSLSLAINGSRDVSLIANVDGTNPGAAGDVNYFQLTAAGDVSLAGGTSAGGAYPVVANALTFGTQDAGTVTIAETGSVANPFVGAKGVEVSRFTLNGATENSWVKRIRLINSGSMNTVELTNVYAQIESTTVTFLANGGADDYTDIMFSGSGYFLEKGKTKTVRVYGDVGGEPSETVKLYAEEVPDVHAVGATYGFGMQVTNNFSTSSDAHTLTLQGGDVTVAFNGPNAADIGTDTDDTVFIDLAVSAATNVDVRKTKMWLCWDDTGNGTYTTITTAVLAEIEDTKIVDVDTGVLLNGPVDASSWTIASAVNTVCTDSVKPASYTFTEDWEIDAGQTRNISFRADVKSDDDLVATDILKVVLEGWGDMATSSGDLTVMRYRDNNKVVTNASIVPASDISGNAMTVNAATITVGLSSSPVDDTYIKGTQDVDFVGFIFTAGDASDMTMTDLTLDSWVDGDSAALANASGSYTNGTNDSITGANVVPSVWLVDKDTGLTVSGPEGYSGTNDIDVIFSNFSWLIPAGQSKTLLVRGNISTTAYNGGDDDAIFFNINANTDVTALDQDGNSKNAAAFSDDDGPNGDVTVAALVSNAGSLAVSLGNDTPSAAIVIMGTGKGVGAFNDVGEGFHASDFTIDATNEAFNVSKVTLEDDGASGLDNVLEMALDYQDENGNWYRSKGTPDATLGEVTLTLNPAWYIPKDDSATGKAYFSVGIRADGADSTDSVKIVLSDDGSSDDQFKAVGASSGTTLDDDDMDPVTTTNTHRVFNTEPTFTLVSGIVADLVAATAQEVGRFTIAADANHAVLFTKASGSLEFDVSASGDGSNVELTLYKSDGTNLASFTGNFDSLSTFAFNFSTVNLTVPAAGSVTLYVEADLSSYNEANDYFGLRLNGDEADNVKWLDEDNASFDVTRLGPANLIDNLPMNFGTATKD